MVEGIKKLILGLILLLLIINVLEDKLMRKKIPRELKFIGFLFVYIAAELTKPVFIPFVEELFPSYSIGRINFISSIPGIVLASIIVLIFFRYWERQQDSPENNDNSNTA